MVVKTEQQFMTRPEAAEFLRMKISYLNKLACLRRGPRYTKFGEAFCSPVRYAREDVVAWATDPARHEREVWGSKARKRNGRRQKAGR